MDGDIQAESLVGWEMISVPLRQFPTARTTYKHEPLATGISGHRPVLGAASTSTAAKMLAAQEGPKSKQMGRRRRGVMRAAEVAGRR